jgi:hypothetical protein
MVEATRTLTLQLIGPNPARRRVQFAVAVREPGTATLSLYNALGRQVKQVFRAPLRPGQQRTVTVSVQDVPSGTYFARLSAPSGTRDRQVVVVR